MKRDNLTRFTDPALPMDAQPEQDAGRPSGAASPAAGAPEAVPAVEPLEGLVTAHQSAMLAYARHLLGPGRQHEADAQDLVQDAFLRLHRQRSERGPAAVAEPKAWLLRVTHNLAMDALRKTARRRTSRLRLRRDAQDRQARAEQADRQALDALDHREAVQLAIKGLQQLPDHQQRVVVLRVQGLTVRQIAGVLDMTPGNVGYHLTQGMTTLSRQLKQKDVL